MKKYCILFFVLLIIVSCGSNGNLNKSKGELVGVKGNKFYPEKPYGMVLIPGGSFIMGKSDDDLASVEDAPTKTVTVKSFYMDETEITNSEYRQFVNWVRDSVLRTALAIRAEEVMNSDDPASENSDGIREYAFIDKDTSDMSIYDKWKLENDISESDEEYYAKRKLNWNTDIILEREDYPDLDYLEIVEDFFLNETEVFNDIRTWDVEKFIYRHKFSNLSGEDGYLRKMDERKKDLISALLAEGYEEVTSSGSFPKFVLYKEGTFDIEDEIEITDKFMQNEFPDLKRSNFITEVPVPIYPDTTVWIRDFKYSYNEPMHNDYFWHDAYSEYPVVGVTWHQARAFCEWRTITKNAYQKTKKNKSLVPKFRLPTEAEWEYAARGGLQGAMYPWGGPYTKNDRGCFMANFKPMRGDYAVDQALYTVEANAYDPNGYNLYNMAGNVSEWVDSSYEPEAYDFSITMNPNVNKSTNKKKIIRGGSWKDVKYFLQVSSRDYEFADQARSYIGFRTVNDYLGTDYSANAMTNTSVRRQNNRKSSIN
jgi:sulfatase modifying factor 1